jgi:hypothetical protein
VTSLGFRSAKLQITELLTKEKTKLAAALLSKGKCVFAWASSFKAWLKDPGYVFRLGAGGFRVGT